ncbi:urate hydroxylase PuuD [Azohydromonas australica]|uniref:urate hydroxylase PuuD n=1 Tax=Azohydromonas australica TaxID=364039 RepID=UPI00048B94E2|nr:urate hydroxylase PuuD [Azohydromonas australica]
MENLALDWVNLLLRWSHVITAIAWVGSSFYFVFLDSSLTRPADVRLMSEGVTGELWAVHGGGFYHPVKYAVSPPRLPSRLHWFFWESYSTWLTGFALFTVSYLWHAGTYLIDKSLMDWSPNGAILGALSFLVVFWVLYNTICRLFGERKHGDAVVGGLVAILVVIASWLACHWFAGRAAFLLVGAMLATAMSANVFFWIIPGQKKVVAAIREGKPVDPVHGKRGKQRSVHNTYFTLPVLFAMLSNHYSFLWNHPQNWLVLVLMMFGGAAIRQFFVARHGWQLGRNRNPLPYALIGSLTIFAVATWVVSAATAENHAAASPPSMQQQVSFSAVRQVLDQRCGQCHGAQLQMKNIRLDSPEAIKQHASSIYQQAVINRAMPMNNATKMTDGERALLGQWFQAGAPSQ